MENKMITPIIENQASYLYNQGLGTNKIAADLNMSKTTIRRYLINKKIKFRLAPKNKVSQEIHNKIVDLYKNGFSIKKIADRLNTNFSTVRRHIHKEGIKIKKRGNPVIIKAENYKNLNLAKSYILGVVGPGDGFIENNNKNGQYRVALEAVDLDFVNYFMECLRTTYGIEPTIKEINARSFGVNNTFRTRLGSKEVSEDLLSYGASLKEKDWTIPETIKKSSLEIKAKYIQGFADSQGCVAHYPTQKSIILSSNNLIGVKEMSILLKDFDINNTVFKHGIRITGKDNLEKFSKSINFIISRKREALDELIKSYKSTKKPGADK